MISIFCLTMKCSIIYIHIYFEHFFIACDCRSISNICRVFVYYNCLSIYLFFLG